MSNNLMTLSQSDFWIVGAGAMAISHAQVAKHLGYEATVIGRGEESASKFEAELEWPVARGGLDTWLSKSPVPAKAAIVAVAAMELENTTSKLLSHGVKRILVEKPAGVAPASIQRLAELAHKEKAQVFVAYNRRFFPSVQETRKRIQEDGGVTSFSFEFTELSSLIETLSHPNLVKQNWFLANSTHVVDLAFFLGGRPTSMHSMVETGLSWHPIAKFAGCGRTENDAMFHYGADWTSAGRWGVEINTPNRRLILRPMETLQEQVYGSFKIENVQLEPESDHNYKPGFLNQMQAFLSKQHNDCLIDIQDHIRRINGEFSVMLSGGSFSQ